MLEFLMMRGEVAIAGRVGRERLWDLPERVYPADVVVPSVEEAEPDQERAAARLARHRPAEGDRRCRSSRSTSARPASRPWSRASKGEWRVDPAALGRRLRGAHGAAVAVRPARPRPASRAEELFDFEYTLEMYKPAAQAPLGLLRAPDPPRRPAGREGRRRPPTARPSVLRVHAIHEDVKFTRAMTKAVQAELEDLASWLGLSAVERP